MRKMNPAILEGYKKIRFESEQRMVAKSCGGGDFNYLQHPNLEKRRVASELINLVRDTSMILSKISRQDKTECSGKIPRIDSCQVTSGGECNTACGTGFGFDTSFIPYDMVKRSAEFEVPRDFLYCNELGEPGEIMEEIMAMFLTRIQNEMELAVIYGDQNLVSGPNQPANNRFLGLNDGILKLASVMAPEAQIIDAMGAGPSPDLFQAAKTALPARYRGERSEYVFFVGPEIKDWYTRFLAVSPTEAGQNSLKTGEMPRIWGNDLCEVPMWREDFEFGDPTSAAGTIDTTHILFIKPSNPLYLSGRRAEMMNEYKIECDLTLYKQYWEDDLILQYPEEVVLIKNVAPCGVPWEGCATTNYTCFPTGSIPDPVQCD